MPVAKSNLWFTWFLKLLNGLPFRSNLFYFHTVFIYLSYNWLIRATSNPPRGLPVSHEQVQRARIPYHLGVRCWQVQSNYVWGCKNSIRNRVICFRPARDKCCTPRSDGAHWFCKLLACYANSNWFVKYFMIIHLGVWILLPHSYRTSWMRNVHRLPFVLLLSCPTFWIPRPKEGTDTSSNCYQLPRSSEEVPTGKFI